MFYPPEGLCGAEPEGGPIVFTFHFIGVGKGTGGFKFWAGNPPFWSPIGSCANESWRRSTKNPFFSFMGPSIGGANVLSMTNLANVPTKNPYFSFMGPSIISAHVFDGVYLYCRSSHSSAKTKSFTAIFYLGGIIFSGPLCGHYLSLFLSYIWSREKFFNL